MHDDLSTIPTAATDGRHERAVGRWLFVSCACFYLLCTSGHIFTPDGVIMFRVTQSLVERGETSIQELGPSPGFIGTAVRRRDDGSSVSYAKYGLGLSLAAIPTYTLGRLLVPFLDQEQLDLFRIPPAEEKRKEDFARNGTIAAGADTSADGDFRWLWYDPGALGSREGFLAFSAGWTNSFLVAGSVLGVYLICLAIGHPVRISLATAVAAAVATPLWPYAKDFFSEPLAGLAVTFLLYFALRAHALNRARPWIWSGVALGVAALAKPALIVLAVPASLLLANYMRRVSARRSLDAVVAFGLGLGCIAVIIIGYDYARFGSLLETGYGSEAAQWTTPLVVGLFGLLASPGRGLLIYFPLWLVLLPGTHLLSRAGRFEYRFSLLCLATLVALYAKWHQWEGGICWGPRFLIPIIPLLMVPVASLLSKWHLRRDLRVAVSGVLLVSTAIAFSGTVVNYFEYANWLKWQVLTDPRFAAQGITSPYQLFLLRFTYAPIVANWTFPRWDYYFVFDALRRPGAVLMIYLVFALGFLLGVARLYHAVNVATPALAIAPARRATH